MKYEPKHQKTIFKKVKKTISTIKYKLKTIIKFCVLNCKKIHNKTKIWYSSETLHPIQSVWNLANTWKIWPAQYKFIRSCQNKRSSWNILNNLLFKLFSQTWRFPHSYNCTLIYKITTLNACFLVFFNLNFP